MAFIPNSIQAPLAQSPQSQLQPPSITPQIPTRRHSLSGSTSSSSTSSSSAASCSDSISSTSSRDLDCIFCDKLQKRFQRYLTRNESYSEHLQSIDLLAQAVLKHQTLSTEESCVQWSEKTLTLIESERLKLTRSLCHLVEVVEGSYTRVLAHDQPSSIEGRGYFTEYYLEDSLRLLHRFKAHHPRISSLRSFEALLHRAKKITDIRVKHWESKGNGSPIKADKLGEVLAESALATLLVLKPRQQLWIPIVTGIKDDATGHAVTLVMKKESDEELTARLVNVGYGLIKSDSNSHYAYDLVARGLPCSREIIDKLSLILSYYSDTPMLIANFKECWVSELEGKRATISRPLCVSHTLRRLYRDHLGDNTYERFMRFWTECEGRCIQEAHHTTGRLPTSTVPLELSIANFENRKRSVPQSRPSLTEKQYREHMKSLSLTYFNRYRANSKKPTLRLTEIPLTFRPYIRDELFGSKTPYTADDDTWSIVLPKKQ